MTTKTLIDAADIGTLITPPECQGQMIDVSYADAEGGIVRCTHDRADGTTVYHFTTWDRVGGDFAPQNAAPRATGWRPCAVV